VDLLLIQAPMAMATAMEIAIRVTVTPAMVVAVDITAMDFLPTQILPVQHLPGPLPTFLPRKQQPMDV
jgi:hypothetical protein